MAGTVAVDLSAIDNDLGTRLLTLTDVIDDAIAGLDGDHRTHLRPGIQAGADLHLARLLDETLEERLGNIPDGHDNGDCHAPLPSRAVTGCGQVVRGEVEVRVGHDHGLVFRAAKRLHPLTRRTRSLVNVTGDRRRPDE